MNENGSYMQVGKPRKAIIFSLESTREKITFEKETKKFVSAQCTRQNNFDSYIKSIENYPKQN